MIDFKQIIKDNENEIIKTLQEIIQIPSVLDENDSTPEAPFGKNVRKCLDYMMKKGQNDGFKTFQDGGYAGDLVYGEKTNDNKTIGILCHLDVVPVGSGWMYPPFDAKIVDGKLYGRGSGDDKGPSIAAYYALKIIKDCGIKLKNQIKMIFGCDEETGWRGISHYLAHYPAPDLGFVPDADFPLIYGEKGRMSYDLSINTWNKKDPLVAIYGGERYNVVLEEVKAVIKKPILKQACAYANAHHLEFSGSEELGITTFSFKGKAAHAMEPQNGINAGTYMCDFLKDYTDNKMVHFVSKFLHLDPYCEKLGLDYNDYEMGPITNNLGIMEIMEGKTRVTLDLRYPVRYDVDNFINKLTEILSASGIIITNSTNKHPHYVEPNDPLVTLLYDAYVKNTGDTEHKPVTIGGGTYASTLPKAVAFGMRMPYEEELAHQKNEYINLDTFFTTILIYIDAIIALGGLDA